MSDHSLSLCSCFVDALAESVVRSSGKAAVGVVWGRRLDGVFAR